MKFKKKDQNFVKFLKKLDNFFLISNFFKILQKLKKLRKIVSIILVSI